MTKATVIHNVSEKLLGAEYDKDALDLSSQQANALVEKKYQKELEKAEK